MLYTSITRVCSVKHIECGMLPKCSVVDHDAETACRLCYSSNVNCCWSQEYAVLVTPSKSSSHVSLALPCPLIKHVVPVKYTFVVSVLPKD